MDIADMDTIGMTPEQLERVKACETAEDILKLVSEEGYEISDAELEMVSGGSWGGGGGSSKACPFCGSTDTYEDTKDKGTPRTVMVCASCGMTW